MQLVVHFWLVLFKGKNRLRGVSMLNYKQPQRCAVASNPTPLPPLTVLENTSPNHTSRHQFPPQPPAFLREPTCLGERKPWLSSVFAFVLSVFFFLFFPSSTSCHARWLCNGNPVPLGGADFKLSQRRERFTSVISNFRAERSGVLQAHCLKVEG